MINNGKILEEIIINSIKKYEEENKALFQKKGYYKKNINIKGCDFYGIINGKYILLECKETIKNKFYTNNITKAQIIEMKKTINMKGKCFIIIYQKIIEKIYIINFEYILNYIKTYKNKVINFDYIKEKGLELKIIHPFYFLDFLPYINLFI